MVVTTSIRYVKKKCKNSKKSCTSHSHFWSHMTRYKNFLVNVRFQNWKISLNIARHTRTPARSRTSHIMHTHTKSSARFVLHCSFYISQSRLWDFIYKTVVEIISLGVFTKSLPANPPGLVNWQSTIFRYCSTISRVFCKFLFIIYHSQFYLTIRLRARDFYRLIVDEGKKKKKKKLTYHASQNRSWIA